MKISVIVPNNDLRRGSWLGLRKGSFLFPQGRGISRRYSPRRLRLRRLALLLVASTIWLAGFIPPSSPRSASLSSSPAWIQSVNRSDGVPGTPFIEPAQGMQFWSKVVPSKAHEIAEFVEGKVRLRLSRYPIAENEIKRIVLGVFANAYCESTWNPRCSSGGNYGLFQLSKNGLGRGKSSNWLFDYRNNTTAILNCPQAIRFFDWAAGSGFDSGEFAFRFGRDVERCSSVHLSKRRRTANEYQKECGL